MVATNARSPRQAMEIPFLEFSPLIALSDCPFSIPFPCAPHPGTRLRNPFISRWLRCESLDYFGVLTIAMNLPKSHVTLLLASWLMFGA